MAKKSHYVGYTDDEVRRMEAHYFCLVLGGDFVSEDRSYLFTKAEITKLHNNTLRNLIGIIEDGEEKDRNYALELIGTLNIKPMRLH